MQVLQSPLSDFAATCRVTARRAARRSDALVAAQPSNSRGATWRTGTHTCIRASAAGSDNGPTTAADGTNGAAAQHVLSSSAPVADNELALSRELLVVYRALQAAREVGGSPPGLPSAYTNGDQPPRPAAAARMPKLQRTMSGRELPPVWADACLSPAALYDTVGEMGASKVRQKLSKTLVLSMLAGCYTSFGAALALTVGCNCPGLAATNPGLQRAVMGLYGLPLGAIMAILTGAELFTGNMGLYASAVYQRLVPKRLAFRAGATAYLGNLIGALTMAALVAASGVFANATAPAAVAQAKVALTFKEAFVRGVLCNWLLNLGVWQAAAATSVIGKTIGLLVPVSAFVAIGFEHSIANMFMIPLGILMGAPVTFTEFVTHNLVPVTLGNVVGGTVCVAGAYTLAWVGIEGLFPGKKSD